MRTRRSLGGMKGIAAGVGAMLFAAGAATAHASWTVTRLGPAGEAASVAYGAGGGQQVGRVSFGGAYRAALWNGTADSFVDLTPTGVDSAYAGGVGGGQQVGAAFIGGRSHAGMWSGTAESWVGLHPAGAVTSEARGSDGGRQVGSVRMTINTLEHAAMWSGTAESWVDLNPARAGYSSAAAISGEYQAGHAFVDGSVRASVWRGTAASWTDITPMDFRTAWVTAASNGEYGGSGLWRFLGTELAIYWTGASSARYVVLQPRTGASASAVTALGNGIQVGWTEHNRHHAAVWQGTAESWFDLHPLLGDEFDSSSAYGVSDDGVNYYVTGVAYYRGSSQGTAVLWSRPIPAPGSGAIIGLCVLAAVRRKSRCAFAE